MQPLRLLERAAGELHPREPLYGDGRNRGDRITAAFELPHNLLAEEYLRQPNRRIVRREPTLRRRTASTRSTQCALGRRE